MGWIVSFFKWLGFKDVGKEPEETIEPEALKMFEEG